MSAARHLVVCGGNGFVGSRICKAAVAHNYRVTSLSRSGQPDWKALWSLSSPPAWASQVEWHKANVFDPSTYSDKLEGASAVVHTMGILIEEDYKGVLTGKEPIISGLKKAFDNKEVDRGKQLTYESMNRDSAITLAKTAIDHKVPTFLYISASSGAPMLPTRYISTKRDAERILPTLATEDWRTISLRPGIIYDSTRPITVPIAMLTGVTSTINSLTGGRIPFIGVAGQKPLKVDAVAGAAVQAIDDPDVSGVVDIAGIEKLAEKAWRKGML
ncbi:hypothetical protein EV426DRAFT_580454 [Tirmania nivea]|nr:hypothetical protein EV426DRAFT_580454 [Tirmania nivea]